MRRSLVLHGPSTLGISLPSKWIKDNLLKKGDEVEISENGKELVVRSKGSTKSGNVEVDISNLGTVTKRVIIHLYQEGYSKIDLKYSSPTIIKKVREVVTEELIGFEIMSQTEKSCSIRYIAGESDEGLEECIKRLFILFSDSLGDGLKGLQTKNNELMELAKDREQEIDRMTNFSLRLLRSKPTEWQMHDHLIVYQLERAADSYYEFLKKIGDVKKIGLKDLISIHSEINTFFDEIYDLVLFPSQSKTVNISSSYDRLKNTLRRALMEGSDNMELLFIMNEVVKTLIAIQDSYLGRLAGKRGS